LSTEKDSSADFLSQKENWSKFPSKLQLENAEVDTTTCIAEKMSENKSKSEKEPLEALHSKHANVNLMQELELLLDLNNTKKDWQHAETIV